MAEPGRHRGPALASDGGTQPGRVLPNPAGETWIQPTGHAGGSVTIAMGDTLLAGAGLASYDASLEMTMEFDAFAVCEPGSAP